MTIAFYANRLNQFCAAVLERLRTLPDTSVVTIFRAGELVKWWQQNRRRVSLLVFLQNDADELDLLESLNIGHFGTRRWLTAVGKRELAWAFSIFPRYDSQQMAQDADTIAHVAAALYRQPQGCAFKKPNLFKTGNGENRTGGNPSV